MDGPIGSDFLSLIRIIRSSQFVHSVDDCMAALKAAWQRRESDVTIYLNDRKIGYFVLLLFLTIFCLQDVIIKFYEQTF